MSDHFPSTMEPCSPRTLAHVSQCASGIPGLNETYVLNTTTYQWTVEQPFDLYGKMVNNPGDGV